MYGLYRGISEVMQRRNLETEVTEMHKFDKKKIDNHWEREGCSGRFYKTPSLVITKKEARVGIINII